MANTNIVNNLASDLRSTGRMMTLEVGSTAVSGDTLELMDNVRYYQVQVQDGDVLYASDGETDPNVRGFLLRVGSEPLWRREELKKAKFVRAGSVNATLVVQGYNRG